jgi:hypothetical protein
MLCALRPNHRPSSVRRHVLKKWMRRIRGAVGLGLTWGVAGFLVGMVIEVIHNIWPNPLGSAVDIWPAALAYPGLLGGLAFSVVLGIAEGRRRFDVSLVPAAMVALGLAAPGGVPAERQVAEPGSQSDA